MRLDVRGAIDRLSRVSTSHETRISSLRTDVDDLRGGITISSGNVILPNGLVVNENAGDNDSRIEGDTDANLVYVDAGNDRVGIGTAAPGYKLDVAGALRTQGRLAAVATKTASYTAGASDEVIVCNKTSAMTITLPAASGSGRVYAIKNINTGTVTIDGDSSDTIDGAASANIIQWEAIQVVDYAANKWVII